MKRKLYIILFIILYVIVAFSSFFHSIEFFSLSNILWMGIILAFAFEIGQAVVLFSILSDDRQHKKILPWLLMCIFTLVQIIGNIYSSYKYILSNSFEDLKFFKEPIFVWTNLPDDQTTVIVTYITSAILPICALLLTAMLTSYLENEKQIEDEIEELEDNEEYENNEFADEENYITPVEFTPGKELDNSPEEQEETEETPEEEDKEYYIEPEDEPKEMARGAQEENMQSHTINL